MSSFSIYELLLFQLLLIILNAIFACAEIAVISINDNKLKKMAEEDGDKRAQLLLNLTSQPAKFLATIQVGITLAGFLGSAFAADNFSDKIVNWLVGLGVTISPDKLDVLAVLVITLIMSYVTLVLGELVPKRIAMQFSEKIGLSMSRPIYVIAKIFSPLVWFLTASTNVVLRLLGINPHERIESVTEEEIRMMVDVGSKNGTIDDIEKNIIHNVFEFDDKLVEDVMTHRSDVVFLDADEPLSVWEECMIEARCTTYPVFRENTDNIVGVLNIKDYLKCKNKNKDFILKNSVKPTQYVPATMHINDLFRNMQKERNYFAIVLDEYGGTDGIVTISDILGEIVGSFLYEEEPSPVEEFKKVSNSVYEIEGVMLVDEAFENMGIEQIDAEEATIGGYVFGLLGHKPKVGDKTEDAYCEYEILGVDNMRISRIKATVKPKEDEEQPTE